MKLSRFLLGMAAGFAAGYLIKKSIPETKVKPEKVIQMVKNRYKHKMEIIGTWIHVEPKIDQVNGIEHEIYVGGFTGLIDGEPKFFEFTADAQSGTLLSVQS